jgi:hypothetical protein
MSENETTPPPAAPGGQEFRLVRRPLEERHPESAEEIRQLRSSLAAEKERADRLARDSGQREDELCAKIEWLKGERDAERASHAETRGALRELLRGYTDYSDLGNARVRAAQAALDRPSPAERRGERTDETERNRR